MVEPATGNHNRSRPIPPSPFGERARPAAAALAPLTAFVGREEEVASALDLLRSPHVRLLTLTGPGGVGKTRLALQIAGEVDGTLAGRVVIVLLAPISEPGLVDSTIVQALGIRQAADGELVQRAVAAIGTANVLLVLDNFEHVLDAAGVVVELLMGCPNLKVLVTSRFLLRISGEYGFEVPPLGLPDPERPLPVDQLLSYEAVRLFTERARAVRSSFAVTAENASAVAAICTRLDGLPLAIELAAARSSVLSPQAMLGRIGQRLPLLSGGPRDAPLRQKTMRDTIAWSYGLLSPEEQFSFRRLSVFAGGFILEAAEAVTADGQADRRPETESLPSALDLVDSLVGKSLLHQADDIDGEPRFAMLETVREYGLEQLAESGDDARTRDRHAVWYLHLAEEAGEATTAPAEYQQWMRQLETEHDNLRGALTWFDASGATESGLRLASSLWPFWYIRGYVTEARTRLEQALARAGESPSATRAQAAVGLGQLAIHQGDFDRAIPLARESLAYYRSTNDAQGAAIALDLLGRIAENTGKDAEAAAIYEEVLAQYRIAGAEQRLVMALVNLADAAYRLGDFERSETLTDEALALTKGIDNQHTQAWPLANAAQLALVRGDRDRARALNEEALALHIALGNKIGVADSLAGLAAVAASLGQYERAASWLGSVRALGDTLGVPLLPHHGQYNRTVASIHAEIGEATFQAAFEAGSLRRVDDAVDEARILLSVRTEPVPRPRDARAPFGLTARELDVLQLLAEGLTDKEIGEALFISWRTAQGHVASILAKLDVATRAAAVAAAIRNGLIVEADQRPN